MSGGESSLKLFPAPKQLRRAKGSCAFGRDRGFRADLPKERGLREWFARWEKARAQALGMEALKSGPKLSVRLGIREIPAEGFRLEITPRGVCIEGREARGAFYGLHALAQIVHHNGSGALPCLSIEDWPDLPVRGFFLDVSRCKVPTLETLLDLLPKLGALRINTLEVYMEHTYAFKGGEIAWADASPLTADDIQRLEAACRRQFIELIPALNGFGHMERWLKHPQFRHLAECPEGYERPLGAGWSPFGSTLKPDAESIAFLDRLYADCLPRFSSSQVNAGCDEPWELGRGASRQRCQKEGRHKVYLDHVLALHDLLSKKYGKRMQFWADILMEEPRQAQRLPRDIIPVLWGYEANHPIGKEAALVAAYGLEFLIAAGSSAWLTFTGRWDNARPNIERCIAAAREHGAGGILLTAWGDNGNLQPWPLFYAPLALASALAWNTQTIPCDDAVAQAVDFVFFGGERAIGSILTTLGNCEKDFPKIHNRSRLYQAALAKEAELADLARSLPQSVCEAAHKRLSIAQETLAALASAHKQASVRLAAEELLWGVRMNLLGLNRLEEARTGKNSGECYRQLRLRIGELETLWLRRARIGGLYEAQTPLRTLLQEWAQPPSA